MKIRDNIYLVILLSLISISVFIFYSQSSSDYSDSDDRPTVPTKESDNIKYKIDSCFNAVDTSLQLPALGCANNFYVLVDDQTVISIEFPGGETYIGCSKIIMAPPYNYNIQIQQFEKGTANLQNRCTCIINDKAPKPIETYNEVI